MTEAIEIPSTVGPDRLSVNGPLIHIDSMRRMGEWQVREFCKVPILISGRKFYLRQIVPASGPFKWRYELGPWEERMTASPNQFILYDEQYVLEREKRMGTERRNDSLGILLFPLHPILGFLWTKTKVRAGRSLGYLPVEMTRTSVFLCYAWVLMDGINLGYVRHGLLQLLFGVSQTVDYATLLVCAADAVFRYAKVLEGQAPGFLEWLLFWRKSDPNDEELA